MSDSVGLVMRPRAWTTPSRSSIPRLTQCGATVACTRQPNLSPEPTHVASGGASFVPNSLSDAFDQDQSHSVPLRLNKPARSPRTPGGRGERPTQRTERCAIRWGLAMRRLIALALLHLPLMGVGWTNRELVFAYPDDAPPRRSFGGSNRSSPPAYR